MRIAIIDGGVDFNVADLGGGFGPGHKIVAGWDYDSLSDTVPDIKWGDDSDANLTNHGNWMTSVAAALTNNGTGVCGVAGGWGDGTAGVPGQLMTPSCVLGPSIVELKVRRDTTQSPWLEDAVPPAIDDAVFKYRCDVISLSFPRNNYYIPLKWAAYDAYYNGTLLVSAMHNDDQQRVWYPACFRNDWVLCAQGSSRHPVSETDSIPERRCSSSDPLYHQPSMNPWGADWPPALWPVPLLSVDVSAPGSHMCVMYADSLVLGGTTYKPYYHCKPGYAGVSYAPPQVAGAAALMLSENPGLTVDDLQGLICASCSDITTDYNEPGVSFPGWDRYTGWGRINIDSCVTFVDPTAACYSIQHNSVNGGGIVVDSTIARELVEFG